MCIFRRKRRPYEVVVYLDGRHPYLHTTELDHPSREVKLTVMARSWSHAASEAMAAARDIPDKWAWGVRSISRLSAKDIRHD